MISSDTSCHTSCSILSYKTGGFFMAGEVTRAVKASVGCLFWAAADFRRVFPWGVFPGGSTEYFERLSQRGRI